MIIRQKRASKWREYRYWCTCDVPRVKISRSWRDRQTDRQCRRLLVRKGMGTRVRSNSGGEKDRRVGEIIRTIVSIHFILFNLSYVEPVMFCRRSLAWPNVRAACRSTTNALAPSTPFLFRHSRDLSPPLTMFY